MVKADKKNIIIISLALALSVGGAVIFYYLIPRRVEVKDPYDSDEPIDIILE
jgi:hypothetical protein